MSTLDLSKVKIGNGGVILGIFLIAAVVFGLMYLSIYILPLTHNPLSYGVISLFLILLGLAAPFAILKLVMHEAHLRDGAEKEFQLKDIPKDKNDLEKDKSRE